MPEERAAAAVRRKEQKIKELKIKELKELKIKGKIELIRIRVDKGR